MVEPWNPTIPCGVNIIMPMPPLVENSFLIVHYHHIGNNINLINGWLHLKFMKLGRSHMPRFRLHFTHPCAVGLKKLLRNYIKYKKVL
jgi:hypothetical protein